MGCNSVQSALSISFASTLFYFTQLSASIFLLIGQSESSLSLNQIKYPTSLPLLWIHFEGSFFSSRQITRVERQYQLRYGY